MTVMKLLLLLLLVGVASIYAQQPRRCAAPREFEAHVSEADPSRRFLVRSRYSYDAVNLRTRRIEEVEFNETRDFFDTLHLHNVQTEYLLNLRTRKCEKRPLTRPFRYREVPPNARGYGEYFVGSTQVVGAGVMVAEFEARLGEDEFYAGTWTHYGCFPVTDIFYSNYTGMVFTTYRDVSLGISDPNVFVPPVECT